MGVNQFMFVPAGNGEHSYYSLDAMHGRTATGEGKGKTLLFHVLKLVSATMICDLA